MVPRLGERRIQASSGLRLPLDSTQRPDSTQNPGCPSSGCSATLLPDPEWVAFQPPQAVGVSCFLFLSLASNALDFSSFLNLTSPITSGRQQWLLDGNITPSLPRRR